MDSQITPVITTTSDQTTPLDPLHRVFVPIEKRMLDGNWRFRTLDKTQYTRDGKTGVIRRAVPKVKRAYR